MTNNLVFACFSPHPPLLLPDVGSEEDRAKVEKTIKSLKQLGKRLKKANPDQIIISSPHPDWGFNVPLHFLAPEFKGKIKRLIIGAEPPSFYFEEGKETYHKLDKNKKHALIASGDLSHRLKEEGPYFAPAKRVRAKRGLYSFHPNGPKFDQQLVEFLKKKDVENFLKLDEMFPEAGECGLRSFSFILGILEASGINWEPKILSYEGPFGVGYLVADFKLTS